MPPLEIRLFGPLEIRRDGIALTLPASRKALGLLAFLTLATRPTGRSQLCSLLWDLPNDPRGELRWSLSKIRALVDDPARRRIETRGDTVQFDSSDCFVDAIEVGRVSRDRLHALAPTELKALADLCVGDFLEGLEIDRSPAFDGWLVAQRRRFRDVHVSLLEQMVRRAERADSRVYLDRWLQLAPHDLQPHERLLTDLATQGRIREGEEHLAATVRLFGSEGIDAKPLRELWRTARAHADDATRTRAAVVIASPGNGARATPDFIEPHRASVAVMPFTDMSAAAIPGGPSDALAHDVITRLAKLRSFRVIAQGTMFALRDRRVNPEEAGRMLDADYIVSGSVQRHGSRVTAHIELAETRSARIVWAEVFDHSATDTFLLLDEIGNRIVASIDREIEAVERNRAILKPPNSLDAWEAHHRGLWHMYRFTSADNAQALHFFETATRLDPTFARAYAGLSFTHWQNAFQGWTKKDDAIEQAYATASQSLMADDHDPAAHLAMGRALWLRDRVEQSMSELERSVELSPNFALGHYSLAFVQSQAGDPAAAIVASDHSRNLSPFDPLLFGMLASRALALMRLSRFDEAADWGVQAAMRPNAHAHIHAIAALSLALAGRVDEGRVQLAAARSRIPRYALSDFFGAFQMAPTAQSFLRDGAKQIGLE